MPFEKSLLLLDVSLLDKIKSVDRQVFRLINQQWTNSFLDDVFPLWREALTWIPLYLFLILVIFINFRSKGFSLFIAVLVTVALTDQMSSHVIKPLVDRPRPCHDPYLVSDIRLLLEYCSNSRSFTSSHATNHFGVAIFLFLTLKDFFGRWVYLFPLWAASISYGQVYIGVHYPVDVICGAILGSLIGYTVARLYLRRFGMPQLPSPVQPVFQHET